MGHANQRPMPVGQAFFAAVLICFVLSGFAALLYQTAWLRQFSIVFGTSELAVAAVLAAYMGGLALGAAITERFINRLPQSIITYAVLEAGIAATALAVPAIISLLGDIAPSLLGNQPTPAQSHAGQAAFYLAITFLALAVPTALMGATLPLLAKLAIERNDQVGPRIGLLYGANALGAVAGVLGAGFYFLPQYGLNLTILIGVAANGATFLVAAGMAILKRQSERRADTLHTAEPQSLASHAEPALLEASRAGWILPLIAASGAVSFLYEVLWTRLLAHILGGSIYSFSAMLASFLAGIALGGAIAGHLSRDRISAARLFCICQLCIAGASAGIYYWFTSNPPTDRGLAANAVLAVAVMTPATLFIGATFPLAVRLLAASQSDSASATARVYAWNTVGAIAGAILAAFFIIPTLQFAGAVRLATLANISIAILAAALILPRRSYVLTASAACLLAAVAAPIQEPMRLVASSAVQSSASDVAETEPLFYAVGSSTTVYVNQIDGRLHFHTNGLPEAQASILGAPADRNTQRWLGALPFVLRPDANEALVVGFGGGIAVEGIPPSVDQIDIIELESAVIDANRAVSDLRGNDPLQDPRVRIFINDARNALLLSRSRYDTVISQPSHPWTPGAANLYTKEFFALVHSRLNEDGVFVQWINSTFLTEELLRSLCATLAAEFDHVALFRPDPTELYFIASDSPLAGEQALFAPAFADESRAAHFAAIALPAPEDVLAAWALDDRGIRLLGQGAPMNSDDHNLMAIRSRSQADGLNAADLDALLMPRDPLPALLSTTANPINVGYLTTRLIATGFQRRALELARQHNDAAERALIQGIGLRYHGQTTRAEAALIQAVSTDPDNLQARYLLIAPYLGALAANRAPAYIAAASERIEGSAATVLLGWRYGQQGQWARLSELDEELARVAQSDLWRPQAVKLRLDWRVQIAAATNDSRLADEALRIADSLLPVYQSADILALRAAAAHLSRNRAAFLESVRALSQHAREKLARARAGEYEISSAEAILLMRRLQGMTAELNASDPALAQQRGPIVQHAELTIRMLAQYSQTPSAPRR